MKILISGAAGFMGREVAAQAKAAGIDMIGVDIAPMAADYPVYASFANAPLDVDCIVDFSRPGSLDNLLAYARAHRVPAVLATTGYTPEQLAQIDAAAGEIAIFRSANMSVGIALLRALSRKAAQVLGEDFDVEIIEAHHNRKADAPSGTALMLFDAVKDVYGKPRVAQNGRAGRDCRRQHGEIGLHAIRGGTVTGEHQVCFLGPAERITVSHSAENRSVFAQGALRAAAFLVGKAPGLYSMDDVVGEL